LHLAPPNSKGRYGKLCYSTTTESNENGHLKEPGAINGEDFSRKEMTSCHNIPLKHVAMKGIARGLVKLFGGEVPFD